MLDYMPRSIQRFGFCMDGGDLLHQYTMTRSTKEQRSKSRLDCALCMSVSAKQAAATARRWHCAAPYTGPCNQAVVSSLLIAARRSAGSRYSTLKAGWDRPWRKWQASTDWYLRGESAAYAEPWACDSTSFNVRNSFHGGHCWNTSGTYCYLYLLQASGFRRAH